MSWILVVVVAGHILTAGTADQPTCDAAMAVLQQKGVAVVCVAAPVVVTAVASPSVMWML